MKISSFSPLSLAFLLALSACTNHESKQDTEAVEAVSANVSTPSEPENTATPDFDINSLPVSDKELGEFPFFGLPEGLEEMNEPIQRRFDRLFVPINGIMEPIEGKVWKSYITVPRNSSEAWSFPYFEKSFDEAIKSAGGVKIFDAKVSQEELDRIKDKATYFGEQGSIDYWNEPVKVYVIRRAQGDDVYIQLSGNTAQGELQILQKSPFKQTIKMLKSDQIQKDLTEKGKAVLYINFDIDKASLQGDGEEAVAEIAKVLVADSSLKLAINGYTDNSGSDVHNLQLSKDRAHTVLNTLVSAGIDKSRLSADGFGASSPIADNTTEDGKSQNRRVELIKK